MAPSTYRGVRAKRQKPARLVVLMPEAELARLDLWAVKNGMETRTQAVRTLIAQATAARADRQTTAPR